MTDAEIERIADRCGMYECHDNGRVNGNTVLDFARAVLAAQLAAPVASDAKDAARYRYIRATTKAIRDDTGENRIEVTPDQFDAAVDKGMK